MIVTGAVLVGGVIAGAATTLSNPTGLPQKPATAGDPVTGPSGQPQPSLSGTPQAGAGQTVVTQADVKDYDALVESSKITYGELKDGNAILPRLVEGINAMINIRLTEDEISGSKNLVSQSGKTGPAALVEMKLSAMGSFFSDKNAPFYKDFIKQGQTNFEHWMQTRNEEHPFEAKFVEAGDEYGEYAYVSNVNLNSLDDKATATVYKFVSIDPQLRIPSGDKDPNDRYWLIAAQSKLVKTDETIPNP